ncbi:MAG: mechanosensitive ion channel family protein [Chitinispirillaceae bacterium]|nr:mechanosensitive ion channel family protein [Chitinispirillaceae bacterium]
MKQISNGTIAMVLALVLQVAGVHAQTGGGANSSLSLERIEEAVAFLEDSAKVATLTGQLRLLAEAKKATAGTASSGQSVSEAGKAFDLFEAGKRIAAGWRGTAGIVSSELQRIFDSAETMTATPPNRLLLRWLFPFLIVVVVGLLIGGLFAFGIRRIGKRMRGTVADGGVKRIQGIAGIIAIRSAHGIGGALALFIAGIYPSPTGVRYFVSTMAVGLLVLTAARTLVYALFSPNSCRIRTIPCPDTHALQITRHCSQLIRLSFMMYLLHQFAGALGMPITCRMILVAYQLIMTVMIPYALYRLRPSYLEPFRRRYAERKKLPLHAVIGDFLLSKLYIIVLINALILLGITAAGSAETHRFFVRGMARTSVLLLAGLGVCALWQRLLQWVTGVQRNILSQDAELQERIVGNIRIIGSIGHIVVASIAVFFVVKIWGVHIGDLFTSDSRLIQGSLRIATIIAGIWLLLQVTYFLMSRFRHLARKRMTLADGANTVEIDKRVTTLGGIFQKIITVSIGVAGVIMVMDELGFDVKAMVAGVGIVGVAVGFGAQNLVRDVISGLFVIFENRIRVGDVAIINGTGGAVEQVNLRTSVLRGLDGTIHVFPNGEITSLSNMTHDFSYYVFNLGVAYKEDTDHVTKVLKQIGEELRNEPEFSDAILEPLEILGVDAFADSAVIIKARIKTLPIKQWFVGREMNRRIKMRFDQLGIEIPFPHQTLYFGEASKPIAIQVNDPSPRRDEMKNPVKETPAVQQGKG